MLNHFGKVAGPTIQKLRSRGFVARPDKSFNQHPTRGSKHCPGKAVIQNTDLRGLLHDRTKALVLPTELFVKDFYDDLSFFYSNRRVAVPKTSSATTVPRLLQRSSSGVFFNLLSNPTKTGTRRHRTGAYNYWNFWEALQNSGY